MSARYPHTCTITRPAAGSGGEDDFGQPATPGTPETVYAGPCYLDEKGDSVRREKGGRVDAEGDGVLRLPTSGTPIRPDTDLVSITANRITRTATVKRVSYLTHGRTHVLLAYDRPAAAE